MRYLTALAAIAACATCLVAPLSASAQQKNEITITRQPGILYLPSHVMEKQHLIEQEAAKRGVPNLKVTWANLSGGGAQTDALLSGNVDVVNTGVGNLLLLWDRTKGGVKGIVANSALPLTLITRNPNVKSIASNVAALIASTIFGFASANFVVVKNCDCVSGPPMISGDVSTTWAPGTFLSSKYE